MRRERGAVRGWASSEASDESNRGEGETRLRNGPPPPLGILARQRILRRERPCTDFVSPL